jgi:hypothetical protein
MLSPIAGAISGQDVADVDFSQTGRGIDVEVDRVLAHIGADARRFAQQRAHLPCPSAHRGRRD